MSCALFHLILTSTFRSSHENLAHRWEDGAPARAPSWQTLSHNHKPRSLWLLSLWFFHRAHSPHRKAVKQNMMINCVPDSSRQNWPQHGVDLFLAPAAAIYSACLWIQCTKFSSSCVICVGADCKVYGSHAVCDLLCVLKTRWRIM